MSSPPEPVLRATWSETTQPEGAPRPRRSHSAAVVGKKVYIFGGKWEIEVLTDNALQVFDLDSRKWSTAEVKGNAPQPRFDLTMAVVGKVFYVFGGQTKENVLNDLHSFDTETGEWKLLAEGDGCPPVRSYHALAADASNKKLYTFGGINDSGPLEDLWAFDLQSGRWSHVADPPDEEETGEMTELVARGGHGLVVVGGNVWLLFGFNGNEMYDVHRCDVEKKTWTQVEGSGDVPNGRSVFGTAVVGKYIVVYGGQDTYWAEGDLDEGGFSYEVLMLNTETEVWSKPKVECKVGRMPGARGWFPPVSFDNCMLVYGGATDLNEVMDDMYVLTIHVD